jgi:ABC-type amino acid transport substrate-binding protein
MLSSLFRKVRGLVLLGLMVIGTAGLSQAADLEEIRQRGTLRHLGIAYANFVEPGEAGPQGLDIELIKLFAAHLGVNYQWVEASWSTAFEDLTGNQITRDGDQIRITGSAPVRGDLIANGLTMLAWREKLVNFSVPTFPTGVWLLARADSSLKPIVPSGEISTDIKKVKALLNNRSVLSMKNTCLDPDLYGLAATGAEIRYYTASENLDEIAPAVLAGAAEATLLDIPDALIALQKWPGEVKVIGPVSPHQLMGVAFPKNAPQLLAEFNRFFTAIWQDGTYRKLVQRYYPSVFLYLGEFFEPAQNSSGS